MSDWTKELIESGWQNVLSGVWKSPSGALFRGPYHAWVMMREHPKLNVKAENKPVSIVPTDDMPLA